MQQILKTNTLAYQFGVRPLVQKLPITEVAVPFIASRVKHTIDNELLYTGNSKHSSLGHPERDALVFYMMNHAMSILRAEYSLFAPLSQQHLHMVWTYHEKLAVLSQRMFYYLLLICTRESRHEKTTSGGVWTAMEKKYPKSIIEFHQKIKGKGSDGAATAFQNSPPACKLGEYTQFLVDVFYDGKYSGGFGGKAWGKVADCLNHFVQGDYSAEMMMDTAFTLCHNNGPIFNKGMLFDHYSSEIYKILDVQRSGQVPQLVATLGVDQAKHFEVKSLYALLLAAFPNEFGGPVDWFKVEELGALHSYKQEQQEQVSKFGYPEKMKAKSEVDKLKQEQAEKKSMEKMLKEAMAKAAKGLEIMPGVYVPKVEVERG